MYIALALLAGSVTAMRDGSSTYGVDLDTQALFNNAPQECFNCHLPKFACGQYAECKPYDGLCDCPGGWTGLDCLTPQCGSLSQDKSKRPRRPDGTKCECEDGWEGTNLCQSDDACAAFGQNNDDPMTCYRNGRTVQANHFGCDVTNKNIAALLGPNHVPEVTFSCDARNASCTFQFWTGAVESFYCALDQCTNTFEAGSTINSTIWECATLRCTCIPDRLLCGANGATDLTPLFTDPDEGIKGPAKLSCRTIPGKDVQDCAFDEDAMNGQLIALGEDHITLNCRGGECLPRSQVPGFEPPPRRYLLAALLISAGALLGVGLAAFLVFYFTRRARRKEGAIRLPTDVDATEAIAEHVPASLHFSKLSYALGMPVLDGISGSVRAGEVLAIIGASGAGKSTLLDILAGRRKRGVVSGSVLLNGRPAGGDGENGMLGYVDQEDTLMPTLTVYETVFNSALLRLPREMSVEAKRARTLQTLHELGILHIRDARIGESGRRGISGGEKRRVSIACELVTSPSVLFLDEPTSGLDAYNAYNVVDSLVRLARAHKRTVVFTIHQPRSNIVALFDRLVVLGRGRLVYSGAMKDCYAFLEKAGLPCPAGFNIADYLIDATMTRKEMGEAASDNEDIPEDLEDEGGARTVTLDEEHGLMTLTAEQAHAASLTNGKLDTLVEAYAQSDIASALAFEITSVQQQPSETSFSAATQDGKGRRRAHWTTQFRILSGRAFKNLYRNPALLLTHYAASITIALLCGYFYYHVPNGLEGFQNRLGLFFFTLAYFAFSCLSSIAVFSKERVLFMRERANGYYSTFTYFASKMLFDVIPLRAVPPLLFGGIVYPLVGLVAEPSVFFKYILVLLLFNLTAASAILLLSILLADTGAANLVGTLVLLFNLMFGGLLINRGLVSTWLRWLFSVSFFHAAYEALAVNELRYLTLIDKDINIPIPAAMVLNRFGLRAQAFWSDTAILGGMFVLFTVLGFLHLQHFVREVR
ncbi:hypothetical protein EXIGLDRAFT_329136 [Exidia glandulosa HHB12029]|uniref:ABC transporter domain-containing protein n=1 Tax=Exidia glandulosa HHB12029 TaxID=1314781 RepID=A0A165LQB5_EXIGL|nr:hypothetical protein EXIGLDRAFT_329136 [Exidia glandulosa HHB12029]